MRIILASKSARDQDNPAATSERLVNLYPVPNPDGGRAQFTLRPVPGTRDHSTVPGVFARAATVVEGVPHIVAGGALFKISEGGTATWLAAVTDDIETAMSGHRAQLAIAAGGDYNLWSGTAISQPGSGRLTTVGSVAFLDQYTLLFDGDGREVEWTEIGDPSDRNALYFRTAEGRDDKIVRGIDAGAYAYIFKQVSTEIWGNTGAGGTRAFGRVPGSVIDTGLLAFNLVCKTPAGPFFIGHDRTAYETSSGRPRPVSTPVVDQALEEETPTHVFYYEDRGHRFFCIRFANRPAWCLDASLGFDDPRWHERSLGVDHDAWDVIGAYFAYGEWHLLSRTGRVYRLGLTPADATGPMRRTAISQGVYLDGKRLSVALLEIQGQWGMHSQTEIAPNWILDEWDLPIKDEDGKPFLAEDPQTPRTHQRPGRVWIRLSRDGGNTWGRPKIKDIGVQGKYSATCRFRKLGAFRHLTVEVNMTDSTDFPIMSEMLVS